MGHLPTPASSSDNFHWQCRTAVGQVAGAQQLHGQNPATAWPPATWRWRRAGRKRLPRQTQQKANKHAPPCPPRFRHRLVVPRTRVWWSSTCSRRRTPPRSATTPLRGTPKSSLRGARADGMWTRHRETHPTPALRQAAVFPHTLSLSLMGRARPKSPPTWRSPHLIFSATNFSPQLQCSECLVHTGMHCYALRFAYGFPSRSSCINVIFVVP